MKNTKKIGLFPLLIVLMRILFGIGWLLAGVTKITEKSWIKEPGVFLREYLMNSLQNSNVHSFYKIFIENFALEYIMIFNYVIPIIQITLGIFLIVGIFSVPSILVCLFMHINFILSGNMNLISLILYTSAFLLIIFKTNLFYFSLDKYFKLETVFLINERNRGGNNSIPSINEELLRN
jgi:thiosulfate dehydrogenase (quinone) large subunit